MQLEHVGFDGLVWWPAKNNHTSDAPPASLAAVTGAEDDGTVLLSRPTLDGQAVVVTGPGLAGKDGGSGFVTYEGPAYVAYDDADGAPAYGETWGAGQGTWKLKKDKPGFKVVGGVVDGRVLVDRPAAAVQVNSTGNDTADPNVAEFPANILDVGISSGLKLADRHVKLEARAATLTRAGNVAVGTQELSDDKKFVGTTAAKYVQVLQGEITAHTDGPQGGKITNVGVNGSDVSTAVFQATTNGFIAGTGGFGLAGVLQNAGGTHIFSLTASVIVGGMVKFYFSGSSAATVTKLAVEDSGGIHEGTNGTDGNGNAVFGGLVTSLGSGPDGGTF